MGYIECNVTTFNGTGQGIYPESLTHVLVFFAFFSCDKIQRDKEKESKSQRVKETKRQRDKETKRQRDKETKRQRDNNTTRQKVKTR